MYADVVFPLKIPPLTYKVPPGAPKDLAGRIVKVPLMGRSSYGLVIGVFEKTESSLRKELKEIREIHRRFASEIDLHFLKWLSDYYITPVGLALRGGFFEEALIAMGKEESGRKPSKARTAAQNDFSQEGCEPLPAAFNAPISLVHGRIKSGGYKSFLYRAHSARDETLFVAELIRKIKDGTRGMIILVPEVGRIARFEALLGPLLGPRLCVLHSKLGKGRRIENIGRILASESDVVLGTRSAAFAPLKELAFIAVLEEHSPSYKGEEGLRYNARDVAVMRGFMQKNCVLLSSVCPSVESVYNARIGKYTLFKANGVEAGYPKVRVIDARPGRRGDLSLTDELSQKAKGLLAAGDRLLLLVNRKGYALIRCEDCGHIEACGKCKASLVFHKEEKAMKCHYCGYSRPVAEVCESCKGTSMKLIGAGTERIKEEVRGTLNAEPLVLEKGRDRGVISSDLMPVVIGTAYAKRLKYSGNEAGESGLFGAAALLNMDLLLSQPDFRAYERAFQEIMQISQLVRPEGLIYIQTRALKDETVRLIRDHDFEGFYRSELSQRKALDYPPFSKIILLNILAKEALRELLDELGKIMAECGTDDTELLGPVEVASGSKAYPSCIQIMLKSKNNKALHVSAKSLLDRLGALKGIKVVVDVDPLRI